MSIKLKHEMYLLLNDCVRLSETVNKQPNYKLYRQIEEKYEDLNLLKKKVERREVQLNNICLKKNELRERSEELKKLTDNKNVRDNNLIAGIEDNRFYYNVLIKLHKIKKMLKIKEIARQIEGHQKNIAAKKLYEKIIKMEKILTELNELKKRKADLKKEKTEKTEKYKNEKDSAERNRGYYEKLLDIQLIFPEGIKKSR